MYMVVCIFSFEKNKSTCTCTWLCVYFHLKKIKNKKNKKKQKKKMQKSAEVCAEDKNKWALNCPNESLSHMGNFFYTISFIITN